MWSLVEVICGSDFASGIVVYKSNNADSGNSVIENVGHG
jgi:hypothetical protein